MQLLRSTGRVLAFLAALWLAATPAPGQHAFDGNIVFENGGGNCHADAGLPFDGCRLLRTLFPHNDEVNPLLGNPYHRIDPNWVPAPNSPALGTMDDVVVPVVHAAQCDNCADLPSHARLSTVCFRGAVPPASIGPDWTQGWIYTNFNGADRTDINYGKPLVIRSGDITSNQTWTPSNNYLLRGRVRVIPPAVLTIQPGTVIFGESSTVGFLMIDRGAKIIAEGTANQPIIFTSDQAPGAMAPGDFGGLLMNGRAIANCANCLGGQSCISEGTDAPHCGTNDCDDSGSLRYVRVEYAGHEVAPNNELNAFTWNSVGANTRVEFCNAFRGSDDLFEWFGGKVTCKYLVGMGGLDDGLDWQMGFRGACQFAVIQQWEGADRGIEADNNEFDFDAPCRSNPVMANVTLIGSNAATQTNGIRLRRGTDAQIYNSIVMGWPQPGIRIEHTQTAARGTFAVPPVAPCDVAGVEPGGDLAADLIVRTFPNPAVRDARFFFQLPETGRARLEVFDTRGRMVASLIDEDLNAGNHQVTWNLPADHPGGTYFYRAESNGRVATGRIVTVR